VRGNKREEKKKGVSPPPGMVGIATLLCGPEIIFCPKRVSISFV
jgi:hypothetical protein